MWLIGGTPDLVGDIDGTNTHFKPRQTLRDDAVLYINGLSRLPGDATDNGYVYDGQDVVLGEPPVPGDVLAIWQQDAAVTFVGGPTPGAGVVSSLSPSIDIETMTPQASMWPPASGTASIKL